MATSEVDIVAKAVEGVLEEVQKNVPWEYAVLNAYPQKKEAIIQAARSAAIEQVKLAKELTGQPEDITERLEKHLPRSRIKMIQEALNLPTFRMDITKESDGKHWVHLTRDNQPFKPPRELATVSDIDWAIIMQNASIVAEAVMLVFSAVGISISAESSSIEAAIEDIVHAIHTSTKLERAVQEFVTAWKLGGGSKWQRATAMFKFIKDTYLTGFLWTTIKSLCSNMSTMAWLKAASQVTAMFIAAFATDGAALIAEIALGVMSAVDFSMKIENVVHLNEIRQGKQPKLTLRSASRHLEIGPSESDMVAKAVKEVLEEMQKNASEEYEKLSADPKKKDVIIQAARCVAIEHVKLAKELAGQPDDITERLAKHLPESRINMILEGLKLPTFRMDITKESDGKHWVHLTRDNQPFKPSRELAAVSDINWATIMQYASIVVEAVMLLVSAVGISISPESSATDAAIKEAAEAIQTSTKFERAVQEFIIAFNAAGGSKWQSAKAMFQLIKDTYIAGLLQTIIKGLCSNMSWLDWLETSAKVTAMVIAALATDGTALIAEIALIVMSAVDFARKIANVMHLNKISQEKQKLTSIELSESDIVVKAIEEVLEQMQKNAAEEYEKLSADPKKKELIIQAARSAADEQVKLANELAGQPEDITERLAKHLPESRINMILKGLKQPTFRMDITKESDGKHWVHLMRDNQPFKPSRELAAVSDIDWATIMQYASIVVETVMLVVSAVGISISPESSATEGALEEAAEAIQTSTKLERAVREFITAWNAAGGSKWQSAKAIFQLIKDTYSGKIIWTIIKSLCSNMSWLDWLETVAKVTAMIIAALATDGVALIAEIALIVMDAVDFARKIANVVQLNEIKEEL